VTTTEQRGTQITPVLSTARQKFLQYTRNIWNFSIYFKSEFIYSTISHRALVGKHWSYDW